MYWYSISAEKLPSLSINDSFNDIFVIDLDIVKKKAQCLVRACEFYSLTFAVLVRFAFLSFQQRYLFD